MKPELSRAATGSLPSERANSKARSKLSSEVSRVRTTSTSFITGTGLKKWSPTTWSGRWVNMAIWVMVSEEVLLAKRASFFTTSSRAEKILFFSSRFSTIASTTMSQSARSSSFTVPERRATASSRAEASSLPRSTALPSEPPIFWTPLSTSSSVTSRTTVSYPERAATSAMPEPIRPQPSTPTFLIFFMRSLLSGISWMVFFGLLDDLPPLAPVDPGEAQDPRSRHGEREPLRPLHDLDPRPGQQLLQAERRRLLGGQSIEVDVHQPSAAPPVLADQGEGGGLYLTGPEPQRLPDPPGEHGLARPQIAREEEDAVRRQLAADLPAETLSLLRAAGYPTLHRSQRRCGCLPCPRRGPRPWE